MYKVLTSCLIASILLSACNSGAGTKSSSASVHANRPGLTTTPANGNPPPAIKLAPVQPTLITTTTPGTNPPHGQPGHRCDIAVGAPLNSQPSPSVTLPGNQPQNNNITINPTPSKVTMPLPANTGSGRLNPPHGQPGHRCDVQVGQPLPSTP
jgi:hypothetical protein